MMRTQMCLCLHCTALLADGRQGDKRQPEGGAGFVDADPITDLCCSEQGNSERARLTRPGHAFAFAFALAVAVAVAVAVSVAVAVASLESPITRQPRRHQTASGRLKPELRRRRGEGRTLSILRSPSSTL